MNIVPGRCGIWKITEPASKSSAIVAISAICALPGRLNEKKNSIQDIYIFTLKEKVGMDYTGSTIVLPFGIGKPNPCVGGFRVSPTSSPEKYKNKSYFWKRRLHEKKKDKKGKVNIYIRYYTNE